jgi:hypothetical protein
MTTRKYVRRSKATINLDWIDLEVHGQILGLWDRNKRPKETFPPTDPISQSFDHDADEEKYSFGREISRFHGNGLSYNYIAFTVDRRNKKLLVRANNYDSQHRAETELPLVDLPRDPVYFFDFLKKHPLTRGSWAGENVFSFNRKGIEALWESLLIGIDHLPKYEIEKMHEMRDYDA